ncbi:UDP-N-acetylmuramoyl-L-alanyl-D-glutamate--2,6-diaminopimelate ligase [Candidatus Beckwithbacteria bacterium]|nr:UDP-N-acetylmuramoyl-L-alanyl-D-glutamate--2,6-diaminopimelate ligase [Candidatus Beckwithbacteria bacterium]
MFSLRKFIPNYLVNYAWHLPKAILANLYYHFPSKNLKIIGVTGTDGKTTTATMLYHVLHENGFKVALISTVSAKIGDEEIDTGFHVTSPAPWALQKLLQKIADKGYEYVVLETTSHGLAQFRVWGVKYLGAIVTNITQDHLDYHKTWERYVLDKGKLFKNVLFSVLNIEDKSYPILKKFASGKILTYGLKDGELNKNNFSVKLKMLGEYNILNALAVAAVAKELGIKEEKIRASLEDFAGVLGRMQVMYDEDFKVIVDFAHTPNALKVALQELRKKTRKRLIAIFGCAGLRDHNRRKMGEVSVRFADITIITAEDPRTEGVEKISEEIATWAIKGGGQEMSKKEIQAKDKFKYPVYVKINDREEAIAFAIKIAQKNDIIGVFGKGHERSMCYGTKECLWTDQEGVSKILKKYGKIKQ